MLADSPTISLLDNGITGINDPLNDSPQARDDFRRGAHKLSGSVTVVTSNDDDEWFGVTSSSVRAVGYEPPTLTACVRRRSRIGRELGRTRRFCVNVLPPEQRQVALAFSESGGSTTDFQRAGWVPGTTGTPVLSKAVAAFECGVDLIYGYPDDLIVVGTVRHVAIPGPLDDLTTPLAPVLPVQPDRRVPVAH